MTNTNKKKEPSRYCWPFTLRFENDKMYLRNIAGEYKTFLTPGMEVVSIQGHNCIELLFYLARTSTFGFKKQKKVTLLICNQYGIKGKVPIYKTRLSLTEYYSLMNTPLLYRKESPVTNSRKRSNTEKPGIVQLDKKNNPNQSTEAFSRSS